jgi:CRP-like cAMP-binding protein
MAIWDEFMERHPAFAGNVMRMMGRRIKEVHTRLKEMATQDVGHRVAHAVLRLVNQSGRRVDEGVLVDFPITRQEIAEVSGDLDPGHAAFAVDRTFQRRDRAHFRMAVGPGRGDRIDAAG